MITEVHQAFLEARTMLPPASTFDEKLIILSVGLYESMWSEYHLYSHHDTIHFVFMKNANHSIWTCVDESLQRWLEEQHAIALKLLDDIQ